MKKLLLLGLLIAGCGVQTTDSELKASSATTQVSEGTAADLGNLAVNSSYTHEKKHETQMMKAQGNSQLIAAQINHDAKQEYLANIEDEAKSRASQNASDLLAYNPSETAYVEFSSDHGVSASVKGVKLIADNKLNVPTKDEAENHAWKVGLAVAAVAAVAVIAANSSSGSSGGESSKVSSPEDCEDGTVYYKGECAKPSIAALAYTGDSCYSVQQAVGRNIKVSKRAKTIPAVYGTYNDYVFDRSFKYVKEKEKRDTRPAYLPYTKTLVVECYYSY